ncbi:MAG TPA: diaminopimelate decarboxylase [Burkholderiales bacterium]|jgi:diaminopimelate decarboxylase|nr:diaminopimelate decarboxylase [Burkholderiales bacterium]
MTSPEFFALRDGELYVEGVPLSRIAAEHGTPCYVYSKAALTAAWNDFSAGLAGRDALVCYAMKANSNLAILATFARLGAGFDIVSGGELKRVLAAGGDPRKVIFSGVGKSAAEIEFALGQGILCFNIESAPELERVAQVSARVGKVAPISLRVNPDVDAGTHPYISTGLKENKFGVAFDEALALYRRAAALPSLSIEGIDCHIGSQLTDISPLLEALDKMLGLIDALKSEGVNIHHLDLGGGLGIRYTDETPPDPRTYMREVLKRVGERKLKLMFEPGRNLVGNAGVLLTRVEHLKATAAKKFAIVDAAMNDLLRPSLYEAYHRIVPVRERAGAPLDYDIVGPVCESGDFLGHDRRLALAEGDLLAVMSAGAYGMVMASNYNTRPRAAEVLVDGTVAHLVRKRERVEDLYAGESVPG